MRVSVALSLLLLCLLVRDVRPSSTSVVSPVIAQTRSSSSLLGEKPAKLCVLYNFPAGGSLALEELAVQGAPASEAVLVVNAESPADLQHVGGFDVAVGFVRASHALREDGELSLLTSLVALMEGLYRARAVDKDVKLRAAWNANRQLVFLVDGIDKEQEAVRFSKICKRLQAVADEAAGLVFPGGAAVEVRVVCRADEVAAAVAQAGASLTGAQIAANMERTAPATTSSASAAGGDASAAEQQAAAACMGLAEDLAGEVSAGVAGLGAGLSMDDVGAVVSAAAERLARSDAAEALHASFGRTDALKFAIYRAKTQLVRALQPPFARLLDARIEASQRVFRAEARKVPTDPQMRSRLERLAGAVAADARQAAASLQAGFVAMLAALPREGVFSVPAYQRVRASECFSCAAAVSRLERDLQEQCVETVRQAFLAGSYNPYIRDRPWAPTHINLNYLVDPRALALGLDYNPLYDEHVEGPANRAEPLLLKGVAELAFDANDQPVAPPGKKWWRVLLDYYQP